MESYTVHSVGTVQGGGEGPAVLRIDPAFRPGLAGLEGFSHLVVVWWAHRVDDVELRTMVDAGRPYRSLDRDLGLFATRSPLRPNPLALTVIEAAAVSAEDGVVETPYLDAEEGTPILDLKPYTPSIDRVERPAVPGWCAHWPASVEASGDFDWESEFRF